MIPPDPDVCQHPMEGLDTAVRQWGGEEVHMTRRIHFVLLALAALAAAFNGHGPWGP